MRDLGQGQLSIMGGSHAPGKKTQKVRGVAMEFNDHLKDNILIPSSKKNKHKPNR